MALLAICMAVVEGGGRTTCVRDPSCAGGPPWCCGQIGWCCCCTSAFISSCRSASAIGEIAATGLDAGGCVALANSIGGS
eukprot:scaffold185_cov321-Prasinococcus_capsulatus_cf.AAC.6